MTSEGVDPEEALDFEIRLNNIIDTASKLPPGSNEETQNELGLMLQLVPAVGRARDVLLLKSLNLGVNSLVRQPPNVLLAIRLRESVQQSVPRRSFFRSILPGTSASTWVIWGTAILLFIAVPTMILLSHFFIPHKTVKVGEGQQDIAYKFVVLIAVAGMAGSAVSIFLRIKDFSETRTVNPPAFFWTGFFKPIIGATFALFVFVAFASGLLNVNKGVDQRFMLLTLAFIAGFSERFAPDLVSRIEGNVAGTEPHS